MNNNWIGKIYSRVLKNLCWSSLFCIKLEYLVVIRKKSINIIWEALTQSKSIITNHIITVSGTETFSLQKLCQNLLSTHSHNWSNLLIETSQAEKLISSQSSFGLTCNSLALERKRRSSFVCLVRSQWANYGISDY